MKMLVTLAVVLASLSSLASTRVSCFTKFYFSDLKLSFVAQIDSGNKAEVLSGSVEGEKIELVEGLQEAHILSDRSSHPGYFQYGLGTDKTGFDGWMGLSFRLPGDFRAEQAFYKGYVLAEDAHGASLHQVICRNK
ncbi:MAG: hypothetical protein H6624_18070 [Bdellovibrionaceae bacterium]|nr:hypothetical protein [Bdellovibrionales bacterium]MCB9086253.1 hypothetical protein [Pseudobdellovibrionaceae bacterium]